MRIRNKNAKGVGPLGVVVLILILTGLLSLGMLITKMGFEDDFGFSPSASESDRPIKQKAVEVKLMAMHSECKTAKLEIGKALESPELSLKEAFEFFNYVDGKMKRMSSMAVDYGFSVPEKLKSCR